MRHQATTDHGTVVRADQAALVVDPDGSFSLLLPDLPVDVEASLGHALIAAIAVKMNDPEWVEGMLADLQAANSNFKGRGHAGALIGRQQFEGTLSPTS